MTATLEDAYATQSPLWWLLRHNPRAVEADYAPYHRQLAELPAPGEAQLRCVFRGGAKSTITGGMVAWAAIRRKARGILVVTATFRDGKKARENIVTFARRAGHAAKVDGDQELLVINQTPIWFRSPGGAVRGITWTNPVTGEVIRPNLTIVDDLETRDTARSKEQTTKIRDWLFADALSTAGPQHPMSVVMLGTPITPTSLIAQALRQEPPFDKWLDPVVVPIVDADGVPAWSVVDVEGRHRMSTDDAWATEFLLNPLPSGSLVFPPERTVWLRSAPTGLPVRIGVDPAADGSDRTAIVAVGAASAGLIVVDAELWAGPAQDAADRVAAMCRRLTEQGMVVQGVTVEAVGAFTFLARDIAVKVAPIACGYEQPKIGKLERAGELTRWHRVGALAMTENLRGTEFATEVHTWTRDGLTVTGHDDGPDAMVWAAGAVTSGWRMQPPTDAAA